MTLDQLKLILEIVIALVTIPSLIFTLWNTIRLEHVRQEQTKVAENLAQVKADGKELRLFLDAENKKSVVQVLKP